MQKNILYVLLFSVHISLFAKNENENMVQSKILQLQDSRTFDEVFFRNTLAISNEKIKNKALVALGNIQDSSALHIIYPLCKDSVPSVRHSALFAIGQIGNSNSTQFLLSLLSSEKDSACFAELARSIARCGTVADAHALITSPIAKEARFENTFVEAIARFANRKISDSIIVSYLQPYLQKESTLEWTTYAAMRSNNVSFIKKNEVQLLVNLTHSNSNVRMWTAAMLSKTRDTSAQKFLIETATRDIDWRVRVNAIRSLSNYSTLLSYQTVITLCNDKNDHVATTAITSLPTLLKNENTNIDSIATQLISQCSLFSPQRRAELFISIAKLTKEKYLQYFILEKNGKDVVAHSKIITALGYTYSSAALKIIQSELQNKSSVIVIAAIDAYREITRQQDSVRQTQYCNDIAKLFKRKDAGISYSIAVAFQDTMLSKEIRRKYVPQLITAYSSMDSHADGEAMVELINVFEQLHDFSAIAVVSKTIQDRDKTVALAARDFIYSMTGVSPTDVYAAKFEKFYNDKDFILLKKYSGARIQTSCGVITIAFRKDEAPFTVLNFILLSEKHFFDNISFHRVVSNFVIQGGDPLGNGSGGPDYAIRTEIHPALPFTRGAVGMASAGRDTEGSQFFITHCPTPHLDGRYSVFAYTKDFEVVDTIQMGDMIHSIQLLGE